MNIEVAVSEEFESPLNAEDECHFVELAEFLKCIDITESGCRVNGIQTGFSNLDRMTSGFQPGELTVVAARPGMGKTALALNIAENVARDGKTVAIFSMEMGVAQLVMRMLGAVGRLNQHDLRAGRLQDDDLGRLTHALGKLNDVPIFIDETPELSALELRARSRRLHRQHGSLGLIVIDYLQLMSSPAGKASDNRATEAPRFRVR